MKFFALENKNLLNKSKSNPAINNKDEITNGKGGVWLSIQPNLIPV